MSLDPRWILQQVQGQLLSVRQSCEAFLSGKGDYEDFQEDFSLLGWMLKQLAERVDAEAVDRLSAEIDIRERRARQRFKSQWPKNRVRRVK